MTLRRFVGFLRLGSVVIASCTFCSTVHAQALLASAPLPESPTPSVEFASPVVPAPPNVATEHKFFDNQNRALFIAVAAFNGADFAVTRANLQSGGQELNPVVRVFGRSTAGLAVNFVGETVAVVSLSYLFHKTGHHKLERAVSLINIATSAGAVTFDLTHR